jgi:hypothetical protein
VKTDITIKPAPGITLEQARDARASAWGYVFQCFRRREGQEGGPAIAAPDSPERRKVEIRAGSSISR